MKWNDMMSFWRLVFRSLTYHWRINLAVGLGVAAATAVLTGALLVGDSVRGSLRHLTLERLGKIDEVLVTDRFFRTGLAAELAAADDFARYYTHAVPAILFPSTTIESRSQGQTSRSSNVLIVGCDASFWDLGDEVRPKTLPGEDEIVLNQVLADDLNAAISSEVVARLPKGNQVPADSPLANKSDRISSLPGLKVVDIIPARGLGRFSLRASQSVPLVAFVSISTLQELLDQEGKINSLLVSLQPNIAPTSTEAHKASEALAAALRPSFEDYGLAITRVTRTFETSEEESETIYDYFSITSDRMILLPEAERAAANAFAPMDGQGVVTYLATTMKKERGSGGEGERGAQDSIPYSMICGIDVTEGFALRDVDGRPIEPLKDNEIVLNSWAADD
ncbi:MAG: hypothetical protein WD049_01025, partial [Candidatus Paceibacterota bacterium]